MKKLVARLFLAVVLASAAPAFMSCTDGQIEDTCDAITCNVADSYDFCMAVDCFRGYSDWNSQKFCYEKRFDSKLEAKLRAEKYVNEKMPVPGKWILSKGNSITIEEGVGDVFYKITVREVSDDYRPGANYTVYFVQNR